MGGPGARGAGCGVAAGAPAVAFGVDGCDVVGGRAGWPVERAAAGGGPLVGPPLGAVAGGVGRIGGPGAR